jgi:hypothetical protein
MTFPRFDAGEKIRKVLHSVDARIRNYCLRRRSAFGMIRAGILDNGTRQLIRRSFCMLAPFENRIAGSAHRVHQDAVGPGFARPRRNTDDLKAGPAKAIENTSLEGALHDTHTPVAEYPNVTSAVERERRDDNKLSPHHKRDQLPCPTIFTAASRAV